MKSIKLVLTLSMFVFGVSSFAECQLVKDGKKEPFKCSDIGSGVVFEESSLPELSKECGAVVTNSLMDGTTMKCKNDCKTNFVTCK